ncbi:hypothetical protein BG004_006278 [Podila humilis]|nr:hypothetical protein BG004_006278 [Podila humilis]
MYPKSLAHFLVLPRAPIQQVTDLQGQQGLEVALMLKARGVELVKSIKETHPIFEFKMGFHLVPSLR